MSNDKKLTTTTIGPSIVIRGKLRSDEDLVVKGRIDAEITSSKALTIDNSGIVNADVQVESVRVSGVLVGNITAASRSEIASDGRVVGDILAPKIVISDGAAFRGRIDMQNFDEDQGGAGGPSKPAPEPSPPPAKDASSASAGAEKDTSTRKSRSKS